MGLSHPDYQQSSGPQELSINPVFTREPVQLPRNELSPAELDPDIAYQVVHDELMLDGNAIADLLLADLRTELPRLGRQPNPQRGTESSSFSHGVSPPTQHGF